MSREVVNEITYPFNRSTIAVWEWISIFILHLSMYVITYPYRGLSSSVLVKEASESNDNKL